MKSSGLSCCYDLTMVMSLWSEQLFSVSSLAFMSLHTIFSQLSSTWGTSETVMEKFNVTLSPQRIKTLDLRYNQVNSKTPWKALATKESIQRTAPRPGLITEDGIVLSYSGSPVLQGSLTRLVCPGLEWLLVLHGPSSGNRNVATEPRPAWCRSPGSGHLTQLFSPFLLKD